MNQRSAGILVLFIISFFCFDFQATSQEALKARPSPLGLVTMKFEDSYVKITYGRPHMRERQIFGGLVPYGELWRTGANEATEVTLSNDVKINGENVAAGTYTLFTIPTEKKWTVILNSELGQWGAYRYNPDLNVYKFEVEAHPNEVVYEAFTIEFEQKTKSTNLLLLWEKTRVSIPIEFL